MPPSPGGPGATPQPSPGGPGTVPTPNQGNQTGAVLQIQHAMKMLTQAMNNVPMGGELFTDILTTLKKFGTHLEQAGVQQDHGLQANSMMKLVQQQAAQAPQQAALRAMMSQSQAPAMPPGAGGSPPQPQPAM
jgi:hypothetical protein